MNTLKQFMNRKWLLLAVVALVSVFILGHFNVAFAEEPDITKDATQLISMFIKAINVFLWPFLIIIGDLMDSDFIVGPGMETRLLTIWVQVRNLVNIGFVLVLLVIAFYNVLGIGGGEGNLALKTALPKLVLGLVLVNFTYIGGKVILDMTNVATTAAFALPEMVEDFSFDEEKADFEQKVCYKNYVGEASGGTDPNEYWHEGDARIFVKPFCELGEEGSGEKADDGTEYMKYTGKLNQFAEVTYFQELNANNIGLVMAVNMGALESLELLDSDKVDSFTDLAISTVFALVMYLVFAISYLVLGILLFTRVIVLWIALALSPLAVLVYVVPQIKEWLGSGGDVSSKVIKHLLSPIIVGLTMTLGYLMISAWDGVARGSGSEASLKFNELMSQEFLMSGIDDLPKFMIAIASVVIVWVGVFAAAEGTIAQGVTDSIKGFGTDIGKALAKAPLTIPTIPVFTRGADGEEKSTPMSVLGVQNLLKQGMHHMEYGRVQNELQNLAQNSDSKWLQQAVGTGSGGRSPQQNAQNVKGILDRANEGYLGPEDVKSMAGELLNMVRRSKNISPEEQKKLAGIFETASATGNLSALQTNLRDANVNQAMQKVLQESRADANLLSRINDSHQNKPDTSDSSSSSSSTSGDTSGQTPPAAEPVMAKHKGDLDTKMGAVAHVGMKGELDTIRTDMITAETEFKAAGTDTTKQAAAREKIEAAQAKLTGFTADKGDDEQNEAATKAQEQLQTALNELKTSAGVTS